MLNSKTFRQVANNRAQTMAITILAFQKPTIKLLAKTAKFFDQQETIGLKPQVSPFAPFQKTTFKLPAKNSDTLGQIADNKAQTLDFIIRSIPDANLKTTRKKLQNFGTNLRQQVPNPRYHHSQHSRSQRSNYQQQTAKRWDKQQTIGPKPQV